MRAGFLMLPVILGALALPRLLAGHHAEPRDPPRPPEAPTPAQVSEARRAGEALAEAQQGWERVEILAPREARNAPGGAEVLPFEGFGLAVDSDPEGAAVTAAGRGLGETPLMANLPCAPGEAIELVVERAPFPPQRRTVPCRADALVRLHVALAP